MKRGLGDAIIRGYLIIGSCVLGIFVSGGVAGWFLRRFYE